MITWCLAGNLIKQVWHLYRVPWKIWSNFIVNKLNQNLRIWANGVSSQLHSVHEKSDNYSIKLCSALFCHAETMHGVHVCHYFGIFSFLTLHCSRSVLHSWVLRYATLVDSTLVVKILTKSYELCFFVSSCLPLLIRKQIILTGK